MENLRFDELVDVHCAFNIMDRCDQYDTTNLQQACREGVRDAHLLSNPIYKYTDEEKDAYDAGNFTCFSDCLSNVQLHN